MNNSITNTISRNPDDEPDDSFLRRLGGLHPPGTDRLFEAGRVIDGWQLTAFVGRGGSGEVWRAVADGAIGVQPNTAAALKFLLHPENAREVRRFAREAELLKQEPHRCLPRFLGAGEFEGRPYLATEYLEPLELPSSDAAVARFVLDLCDGVAFLHALGFVHRDIKPSNVMARAGRPVLIDLGLVKDVTRSPALVGAVPASSVSVVDGRAVGVGTPGYASPEQFGGQGITPASDVHALGILADQCFRDRPPRCWREIIRRATSSLPSMRYGSIEEFRRAVRLRHTPSRMMMVAALASAAAAAAIVAVVPTGSLLGRRENVTYVDYAVTDGNVITVALKSHGKSIPPAIGTDDAAARNTASLNVAPPATEHSNAATLKVASPPTPSPASPSDGIDWAKEGAEALARLPSEMVEIPGREFLMSKYEVTQALWREIMDANPSGFKGATLPVEGVSWLDCQDFIAKLNKRPEIAISNLVYRLPTMDEWAYCARGGVENGSREYDYGRHADGTAVTNAASFGRMEWYEGNSNRRTHPVGQKEPNFLGLYDMLGNVMEWTATKDPKDDNYAYLPWRRSYISRPGDRLSYGSSTVITKRGNGINCYDFGLRLCADRRDAK